MKEIRIGLIGHKFMGRAHTHAYTDLPLFFQPEVKIVKKMICATSPDIAKTADQWGWESNCRDWRELVDSDEIDAVDISAPSAIHAEVAIRAAQAGKHVFCEKPLALRLDDAKRMVDAVEAAGVVNMIGFNYRFVPALALAKQLIEQGELGEIYHFRGIYQQGWLSDPQFPLVWRLQKQAAGYGSLGDLGAHVIDLARYLVGEIDEISAMSRTYVTERPKPAFVDGLVAVAGSEIGRVDVDDATGFLAGFRGRNTMGYFEMTRYGTGHRNQNRIEINGSKGSLIFDMEQMNDLQFYSESDAPHAQGFRRIQVGEGSHPYMAHWWPAGHIIGYGDTFVNQASAFISAIRDGAQAAPDFRDGLICQQVLAAAAESATAKRWIKVESGER